MQLTAEGRFYEYMMEELGLPDEERGSFKTRFFGEVFYCSQAYSERTQAGKAFQQLFPNVLAVVNDFKEQGRQMEGEKETTFLPVTMQQKEAGLILGAVGGRLAEEGIWYATIHDSVVVLLEHAERVRELIEAAFMKAMGVAPTVKAEILVEDLFG